MAGTVWWNREVHIMVVRKKKEGILEQNTVPKDMPLVNNFLNVGSPLKVSTISQNSAINHGPSVYYMSL
jgi:hypothetical protein